MVLNKLINIFNPNPNTKQINDKIIYKINDNIIKILGNDIEYVANILDFKDLKAEDIINGFEIIKDRELILDWFYR